MNETDDEDCDEEPTTDCEYCGGADPGTPPDEVHAPWCPKLTRILDRWGEE